MSDDVGIVEHAHFMLNSVPLFSIAKLEVFRKTCTLFLEEQTTDKTRIQSNTSKAAKKGDHGIYYGTATRSNNSRLSLSHRHRSSVWITKCFLLLLIALACAGCTANSSFNYTDSCSPASSSWTRPFLVALLTDPHMGALDCSPEGLDCEALVRTAATHVKRLQPDLILWAGDLLQDREDEESYETMKDILEDMSHSGAIPYYVIPGNTDVGSVPTLQRLNNFQEQWQLPYYWYTVEYYDTRFLMLDSNILRNRDNTDEAEEDIVQLAREELEWLEATLDEASSTGEFTHVIAIAHHPLAVQSLTEDTSSENTPYGVRLALASIYQQHIGTLKLVLSGHLHYAGRFGGQTPQQQYVSYPATTFILGERPRDDPSGFALLTIDGDRLEEQYYGYNDMPVNRPESEEPGFEITFPSGELNLLADSQICITWTSQSMTNYVRLDYSLDAGQSWSLIADQVPNEGVCPWTLPPLQQAAQFLVRISSVHDSSIFAVSPEPSQIVLLENNDDITGENDDEDELTTTTNNTEQPSPPPLSQASPPPLSSLSQGKFPASVEAGVYEPLRPSCEYSNSMFCAASTIRQERLVAIMALLGVTCIALVLDF